MTDLSPPEFSEAELRTLYALVPRRFAIDARLASRDEIVRLSGHDEQTGQAVLIKLAPEPQRLYSEGECLQTVRHPNIVRALSWGEHARGGHLVIERIGSADLAGLMLDAHGQVARNRALGLWQGVVSGVAALHRAGFIHRDIKPGNIALRDEHTPVLIDFETVTRTDEPVARDDWSLLTNGYAAPEQYTEDGDERAWTDVYALGALGHELLTGTVPPPAPRRLQRDDGLRGLANKNDPFTRAVLAALTLNPQDRPRDATALLSMLEGIPALRPQRQAGNVGGFADPSHVGTPRTNAPQPGVAQPSAPSAAQDAALPPDLAVPPLPNPAAAHGDASRGQERATVRVRRRPMAEFAAAPGAGDAAGAASGAQTGQAGAYDDGAAPPPAIQPRGRRLPMPLKLLAGLLLCLPLLGVLLLAYEPRPPWLQDALERSGVATIIGGTPGEQETPSAASDAVDWLVDPDGAGQSRTIAEAVAQAPDNAVIGIRPGRYEESLTIDRALTLRPVDEAEPPQIAPPAGEVCVTGLGDGIVLDGLYLTLANEGDNAAPACILQQGGSMVLRNLAVTAGTQPALMVEQNATLDAEAVSLSSSRGAALYITGASTGSFTNGEIITEEGPAAVIRSAAAPTVTNTRIERGALVIAEGATPLLENNTFRNSRGSAVEVASGAKPVLRGNTIQGPAESGLFIYGEAGGVIAGNIIREATLSGVVIESGAPELQGNVITVSGEHGVLILGGAATLRDNEIVENAGHGIVILAGAAPRLTDNTLSENREPNLLDSREP